MRAWLLVALFVFSVNGETATTWIIPAPFYTPETRLGLSLTFFGILKDKSSEGMRTHPSNAKLTLSYTQNRQISVTFLPTLSWREGDYKIRAFSAFQIYPNRFYGLTGRGLELDPGEPYSSDSFRFHSKFLKRIYSQWRIGFLYAYERHKLLEKEIDGALEGDAVPGAKGASFSGPGLLAEFDSRDNEFFPSEGLYLEISGTTYFKFMGTNAFEQYVLDTRAYYTFIPWHILALQFFVKATTQEPPFQALSKLGGDRLLRGVYNGRYQDRHCWITQAEYRFPIWWRFSGAAFMGLGSVSYELENLLNAVPKLTGGGGLRLQIDRAEKVNLRADFAFGPASSGAYIGIGEAF